MNRTGEEFVYGHDQTFHRTTHLDVEVDSQGHVVAVWFRCLMLPFEEHRVDAARATEMRRVQELPSIHAIHVEAA